jgi:hypothetical protein
MGDNFNIEFEWLDREVEDEVDRALAASIGLVVRETYLTRLEDIGAKTVRNHMRGSAWHLSAWIASNWWRLICEPERKNWWKSTDWRLAHCVASAGGGFVWPNAVFASDGESIGVAVAPRNKASSIEPIAYINRVEARISVTEFVQSIDNFMDGVLSRLDSLKVKNRSLSDLWTEVLAERHDPEANEGRKLEALAGYDPDEAPEKLIKELLNDGNHLGKSALEELAASECHATDKALQEIRDLTFKATPCAGGTQARMPRVDFEGYNDSVEELPWQRGTRLAAHVRNQWDLGSGPVSDQTLAAIVDIASETLTNGSVAPIRMPVALRTDSDDIYNIYFNRPRETTRRFALSRLIGDHLRFTNQDRLRLAADTKTARQKFQRSFAQAFLCPIDSLRERIGTSEPDEDDIAEAAAHFKVSPLMVKTTLVNNGELERDALFWPDRPMHLRHD